ncbi:MAG: hypothetical protein ACP5SH_26825 [Syntrophobacteraceae bacterium]
MNAEILVSLHRHWVWADRQKELFEYYLRTEGQPSPESLKPDKPYMLSSMFTCMFLWYGLLYVTCDGIEKVGKTKMAHVSPTFNQVKGTLYQFRNAMFHVQPQYWSPKLLNIFRDQQTVERIRATHVNVGTWLEEQLKPYTQRNANTPAR